MSGYVLSSGQREAVSSWYCPVCQYKVRSVYGGNRPAYVQWAVKEYPGGTEITGCIVSRALCCSSACQEEYEIRIRCAVSKWGDSYEIKYIEAYVEIGALSLRTAEAVSNAAGD